MKRIFRIWQSVLLAAAMLAACVLPLFDFSRLTAAAISADYPAQLINIAAKDNSTVLTEAGFTDGSAVNMKTLGSDLASAWRFDRVGSDSNGTYFKICNAQSGRLLTPLNYNVNPGANVIVYGSESAKSQHWYVVPVGTDRLKNNLYFKILNYENTSLALTQGSSGMTLANDTGADNQIFLLHSDGLQGFAGYCTDDNTGSIKAGDLGGLFGEVVEAASFDELKKYATAEEPYTIVVTKNISVTELNLNGDRYMCTAGRIYVHSNKTIIGSYGAHTLFNVQFCTTSGSGVGNNIIIKNFDMQHDAESNNNDSIVCYFGSGENIWVDHVTFTGHNNYGKAPKTGLVDEDKFLACCYDADYCTVSDCSFGAHKYGLILGYPADSAEVKAKYDNYPRMSLISNRFNDTNTRGPGLMRWGYFHSLNNYVNQFSMAYTVISNCHIFAENCVYENGGNVICDWDQVVYNGQYSESGSIFSGCNRTQQGGDSNSTAQACSWRPKSNYSYISLSAEAAKTYCTNYSGSQTSGDNFMYLRFAKPGVPSAGFTEVPSGPIAASFADGSVFRIQNVNSGLYMQIADGTAENNANIQQWGSTGTSLHDLWILKDAGEGYYYIAAALDENYVLDVAGKNTANGTNIALYRALEAANQQFMLTANGDDSYKIRTRVSGESSAVEVADAETSSGANVQEWEVNGASCQDWYLIPAALPISGTYADAIWIADIEHSSGWDIKENTAEGDLVFGDRTFTITELPDALVGSEHILTACDSKLYDGENAVFTAAADETVYIALDQRVTEIPAWLSDYTKTDMTLQSSNEVTFVIYEKNAASGEQVTLGTNGQSSGVVGYTVFIQSQKTEPDPEPDPEPNPEPNPEPQTVPGDVNGDGLLTDADAELILNWLLAVPDTVLADWQAADLNGDGILTATDLSMMKARLAAPIT